MTVRDKKPMDYDWGFLGRPLPGTLRIVSKASCEYMASRVMGLSPATERRCFTAFGATPRIAAISLIVKPLISISHFREKITKNYIFLLTKNMIYNNITFS